MVGFGNISWSSFRRRNLSETGSNSVDCNPRHALQQERSRRLDSSFQCGVRRHCTRLLLASLGVDTLPVVLRKDEDGEDAHSQAPASGLAPTPTTAYSPIRPIVAHGCMPCAVTSTADLEAIAGLFCDTVPSRCHRTGLQSGA